MADSTKLCTIAYVAENIAKDIHAAYWLAGRDAGTSDYLIHECREKLAKLQAAFAAYDATVEAPEAEAAA